MSREPLFKFTPPQRRKEDLKGIDKLLVFFVILLLFLVSSVGLALFQYIP